MASKLPKVLEFEKRFCRKEALNKVSVGDFVDVHSVVKEGDKSRVQIYSGTVIGKTGSGISSAFIVRRVSMNEGMERKFFIHSPTLNKVEITGRGVVRRAKLNFLKGKTGKKSKLKLVVGK